jgi:hypothetical protein
VEGHRHRQEVLGGRRVWVAHRAIFHAGHLILEDHPTTELRLNRQGVDLLLGPMTAFHRLEAANSATVHPQATTMVAEHPHHSKASAAVVVHRRLRHPSRRCLLPMGCPGHRRWTKHPHHTTMPTLEVCMALPATWALHRSR